MKKDGQWLEYGRQKEAFDDYLFNKYQRRLPILPFIVEANPTVNTADEFYSLAQKYIAEGNQEHFSIDCLHAAITLNPNHGNALCLLGIIETSRLFGSLYCDKNDGFVHLKNARDKGHSLASALMSKLEAAEHRIRLRGTEELYEVGRIVSNKHSEIIESDTSISSSNGNQYQSLYFFSKPRSETTHHDYDRDYDKRNDASHSKGQMEQSNTSRGGAQSRGTGYDQCFYRSSDSRGDLYKCGTRDAMLSGTSLDNNRTLTVRDVDGREIYHSTVSASRNGNGFVSYSDANHGDTTVMHVRDVDRSGNGFDTGNPFGDAVDQAMARR